MTDDISPILQGWEYDPDRVNARKIIGLDGREKVQMRVDLGLIQMEAMGRPDGRRPLGMESLLEYHLARAEASRPNGGKAADFQLTTEECRELRDEGTQYYLRYLSLFHVGDYPAVTRDTARNLKLFDLVRDYAAEEDDRLSLEQYRAYVIMMNTRARALMAVERKEFRRAAGIVNDGIRDIEEFLAAYSADSLENCREIVILQEFAEQIREERPPTEEDLLHDALREAVAREEYERAAQIRDQLRRMGSTV